MFLLVTSSERASECVAALHAATGEEVLLAESLAHGTGVLREKSFRAVIFDQFLADIDAASADAMLEQAGTAMPIQVNLAICGVDRLAREIRNALRRREREEASAMLIVASKVYGELNGTMTALLLCSESALSLSGLSNEVSEKLQTVYELVKTLRVRLETIESTGGCEPTIVV